MAENKTTPIKLPELQKPSLSETSARDQFIAIALGQIVAWQMAEGKINHDQAGAYAVRYANAAMKWRTAESGPLNLVVAKNEKPVPSTYELLLSQPPQIKNEEPPKTIAEIIGEGEPVAELK